MITVEQLMSEDVVRVDPDVTMERIKVEFQRTGFRHAVVIEDGALLGVISDRDVLRTISPFVGKMAERPQDVHSLQRRAHQVMTRHPVTASAGAKAWEAAKLMHDARISCVPVLDEAGRVVGIFTWRNALAWAADASERLGMKGGDTAGATGGDAPVDVGGASGGDDVEGYGWLMGIDSAA